jgi:hypothetical protein
VNAVDRIDIKFDGFQGIDCSRIKEINTQLIGSLDEYLRLCAVYRMAKGAPAPQADFTDFSPLLPNLLFLIDFPPT